MIRCFKGVLCLCTDWPLARVKAMGGKPGMYQGQLPFTFSLTYSYTYLLAVQEKIKFQFVCMLLSDVSVVPILTLLGAFLPVRNYAASPGVPGYLASYQRILRCPVKKYIFKCSFQPFFRLC